MASHDLINTKPTILGATLGAIPGIGANPPERFSFALSFSERFFENWGGPRAQDLKTDLQHANGQLQVSVGDANRTLVLWWHFKPWPTRSKSRSMMMRLRR